MANAYPVKMTGAQLRVVHEALSMILNDPDWGSTFGPRDWATMERAAAVIADGWRTACRAESTPATP
jgi:hypothetical protein